MAHGCLGLDESSLLFQATFRPPWRSQPVDVVLTEHSLSGVAGAAQLPVNAS